MVLAISSVFRFFALRAKKRKTKRGKVPLAPASPEVRMADNLSPGRWIKTQREGLALTQEQLAEQIGCAAETLRSIESGRRRPSPMIAQQLATHLKILPADYESFIRWVRGLAAPADWRTPSELEKPALDVLGDFTYDVFVSYTPEDEEWVRGELLPRLEAHGLHTCVDFRDFRPGATRLGEIEHAALESRKTLIVLSPAYLANEWVEAGNTMVQSLDPASRRQRLIPLLKESCELPLRLDYLVPVNLAGRADPTFEWDRLIASLR
jgi:DNA-binding XRE family transcriptional regulator